MDNKIRCFWAGGPEMQKYHDKEWGVPIHNDRKFFEFLILEGAQAGLNWETILKKQPGYKKNFANFDYNKVAKFTVADQKRILQDAGIIRNRLKVSSAISNAQAFLEVRKECATFDKYIWQFVNNKVIDGQLKIGKYPVATTKESEAMSKDLKKRGFRFVGPTICYAFMQATGMVNDHNVDCYRYKEVKKMK